MSQWVPQQSGGLFKKGNALVVEAQRQVAEGEIITMDFGAFPEPKLDSQVLLDYGAMDVDRSQVRDCTLMRPWLCMRCICVNTVDKPTPVKSAKPQYGTVLAGAAPACATNICAVLFHASGLCRRCMLIWGWPTLHYSRDAGVGCHYCHSETELFMSRQSDGALLERRAAFC